MNETTNINEVKKGVIKRLLLRVACKYFFSNLMRIVAHFIENLSKYIRKNVKVWLKYVDDVINNSV